MYIASNGIKTAVIMEDRHPISPRDPNYQENLGKMVCWHRRYGLGDKHDFESPRDFAEFLAYEYLDKEEIFKAIKDGKFRDLHFVDQGDHYQLEVNVSYNRNDTSWFLLDTEFTKDLELRDESDFDMMDILSNCSSNELLQLCDELDKIAIKPLNLYDHYIQSIST